MMCAKIRTEQDPAFRRTGQALFCPDCIAIVGEDFL